ncbi:permease, partial [Verrucosispora sp. SN26_14.1]
MPAGEPEGRPTGVATEERPAGPGGGEPPRRWLGDRIGSVEILAALLVLLIIFRDPLAGALDDPRIQTWTTVFVSIMVQAVPFLVFGILLSAVIAVFVPRSFWARALPRHPALAVPAASAAGVVL